MKKLLTALAVSAVIGSSSWAVSHEEKPLSSAEIVENGKLLHKYEWDDGYGGLSHVEMMIAYQKKYFICLIDRNILHCEEKKVFEATMLGNK